MKATSSSEFIHAFVPGRSTRTLLMLHGTGGTENDLVPLGRKLDPEAAILSPRGRVLENGMPRFFRRLAEGVFDEPDLISRTHELADFLAQAATRYELDPDNLVAIGYSNGANIAGALLLLRPESLAAAALLRAMVPLVPPKMPDLTGKRVLIASGIHDPIASPSETEELSELIRAAKARVTTFVDHAGHGLTGETVAATRDWLLAR